jgi:type IV secretory pathway TrbF-like protein
MATAKEPASFDGAMETQVMTILSVKPESPYLAASSAVLSEYERLAHSNRMMRHSLIAMAIALVLSATLSLYLARKPHVVPYVVELDKAGEITGVARPPTSR